MSTQMYLMGGLVEGRIRSDRELTQLSAVRSLRREARERRRASRLAR